MFTLFIPSQSLWKFLNGDFLSNNDDDDENDNNNNDNKDILNKDTPEYDKHTKKTTGKKR